MTNNVSNSSIRVPQWIMSILLAIILGFLGWIGKTLLSMNTDLEIVKKTTTNFDNTNTDAHKVLWSRIGTVSDKVTDVDTRTKILEDRSRRR